MGFPYLVRFPHSYHVNAKAISYHLLNTSLRHPNYGRVCMSRGSWLARFPLSPIEAKKIARKWALGVSNCLLLLVVALFALARSHPSILWHRSHKLTHGLDQIISILWCQHRRQWGWSIKKVQWFEQDSFECSAILFPAREQAGHGLSSKPYLVQCP
jgi:hypothetical protein